jgi:hypothetical protein
MVYGLKFMVYGLWFMVVYHRRLKFRLQIYDCEIGVVKCFAVFFYLSCLGTELLRI